MTINGEVRFDFGEAMRREEENFNRKMALSRMQSDAEARAELRHAVFGTALCLIACLTVAALLSLAGVI